MSNKRRPLPRQALAAVLIQEGKLDRLRKIRALQVSPNLNADRIEVLRCELEALDLIEAAVAIVQAGRAA